MKKVSIVNQDDINSIDIESVTSVTDFVPPTIFSTEPNCSISLPVDWPKACNL